MSAQRPSEGADQPPSGEPVTHVSIRPTYDAEPTPPTPRLLGGRLGRYGHDLVAAGVGLGTSAVLGPLAGLVWQAVTPKSQVSVTDGVAYWANPESKTFVAQDGWFAGVTLVAGLICAVVVFLLARRGGIGGALGLAVGGVAGALACAGTGMLAGPGNVIDASQVSSLFPAPLQLQSVGFLFVWPIVAIVLHLVLQGVFGPADENVARPGMLPELRPDGDESGVDA